MARLFVAVWPAAHVVDALRQLPRPERPGLRWTAEEQWHVTLRFLGEAPIDAAADALAAVSHPRVTALVDGAAHRLGPSAYVLPVGGLDPLASAVNAATAGIGRPPDHATFNGHLTLARIKKGRRPSLPAIDLTSDWTVSEVTLVRSDTRASGARYTVVGRVAL